jgi:hypothetical protein
LHPIIAKFELQIPLDSPERYVQKSRIADPFADPFCSVNRIGGMMDDELPNSSFKN